MAKAVKSADSAKTGKTADSASDTSVQANLEKVRAEKKAAVANEDFAKALELKQKEEELQQQLMASRRPALESELKKVQADKKAAIASEDFATAMFVKQREQEILKELEDLAGQSQEDDKEAPKAEKPKVESPSEASPEFSARLARPPWRPPSEASLAFAVGCSVNVLEGDHKGMEGKVLGYLSGWWQLELSNGVKLSLRRGSLQACSKAKTPEPPVKAPVETAEPAEPADGSSSKKPGRPKANKAVISEPAVKEPSDTAAPAASSTRKKPGPKPGSTRKSDKDATATKKAGESEEAAKAEASTSKKSSIEDGKSAQSLKKKHSEAEDKAAAQSAQVEGASSSKKARTDSENGKQEKPSEKQAGNGSDPKGSEPICTPERAQRPSGADENAASSLKERGSQAQKKIASATKEVTDSRKEQAPETGATARTLVEDHDEAEVADTREISRRILSELFPLMNRASFEEQEDNADILPASTTSEKARKRPRRSSAEAEDGDEDEEEGRATEEALQAEEQREREERQKLKAAFAAVENASYEDFDRFPMVAASFKIYLQGTVGLDDKEADETIKVFYELFQQDGKSVEAMASETYARLVKSNNRPMEEQTVAHFKCCWSQISEGPFAEAPPREERGQEMRMRQAVGIPKDWGIRIWQRANLEALVIITSPEGQKHYAEESKVQDLEVVKELSVLFAEEKERLSHESALERQRKAEAARERQQSSEKRETARREARVALESVKESLSESLCSLCKSTGDGDIAADEEKKALPVLHRALCSCENCGRAPPPLEGRVQGNPAGDIGLQDETKEAQFESYDDMLDATEEEKEQYPFVLASFHYAGFEYVTGLRKLMELHKKKPLDMATTAYKRLVAKDPENAQCNGYLNSAVLYFIKFREEGGFDKIMSPSDFAGLQDHEQRRFTPDFDRDSYANNAQAGWDDLQIEIPLDRMMVDATEAWHTELLEKLNDDRFITEDIDASGYQAKALSISLLPNATPDEWQRWPRILAKFERTMKEQSEESTGIKRETEAANLFLTLKDFVEEHGKSPTTMASKRYVRITHVVYENKVKRDAVARFADFWEQHKDGEFPEPKVHAFSKDKYTVIDLERVEAAKKVATEWDLPQGWAVKLKKDGSLLKIMGPGKDEVFRTLEEARDKAVEKAKEQAEKVQSQYADQEAVKDARLQLGARQVLKAADQEQADEAVSEKADGADDVMADAESTTSSLAASLRSKPGKMPKLRRVAVFGEKPKIDRVSGKGGGGKGGVKRKGEPTRAEELMKEPLKVRKSQGLGRLQRFQTAACELILKAHQWRVMGVRVGTEIRPLGSEGLDELPKSEVRLVLAYVFEDVRQQKIRRIVDSWDLDDSYKVSLRVRLSGDQVTVTRIKDGKTFTSLAKLNHDRRRVEVAETMQQLLAFLRVARQEPIWELDTDAESCLSGFYRKTNAGFERLWARNIDDGGTAIGLTQTSSGDAWELLSEDGQRVLARIAGPLSDPFESTQLQLCSRGTEAATEELSMKGQLVCFESAVSRVISEVTASRCTSCSCGVQRPQRFRRISAPKEKIDVKKLRNEEYEARLEELAVRREAAPRTLLEIVDHMLCKLPALLNTEEGALHMGLRHSKTFRIGTMCSGTDAPVIVAKTLQRALNPRGSGITFEHAFSVEIDPGKQEFLRANFPECPKLFEDVTQMGRGNAWEVLSQSPQPIPGDLDLLIAGFSCKDLSLMNSYRKTLMEMGQSGATLRGVLNYIDRYQPRIVLLENVYAIAKPNPQGFRQVDLVIEGLKARGYASGYNLLNSCDFYLPQIRHRVWMWAVRVDDVALDPTASPERIASRTSSVTDQIAGKFTTLLQGLEEPCALHFDDLLLDDDHPAVRKHFAQMKAMNRNERTVTQPRRKTKRDWQMKYAEHRSEHDYQFDTPYTSVRGEEFLEVLNKREKELLDLKCLDILSERGVDPRVVPMLWELSQSVERVPGTRVRRDRQNYATCILPGMLWHSSRHRWVLGLEKLALQGIFAQDLRDSDFPQRMLGDLAGNAFTTSVCAANLITALICAEDVNPRDDM